jgi:hypothetical protein
VVGVAAELNGLATASAMGTPEVTALPTPTAPPGER